MRNKQYNIKLNETQAAKLEQLCIKAKRTPSDLLYLLVSDCLDILNVDKVDCGVVIEDLR